MFNGCDWVAGRKNPIATLEEVVAPPEHVTASFGSVRGHRGPQGQVGAASAAPTATRNYGDALLERAEAAFPHA